MAENIVRGLINRLLQLAGKWAPGATSIRAKCHRWRGVNLGKDVWIGYDCILETSQPHLITIKDRSSIGMRTTIIAHFKETRGVIIEEDVFIGPSVTILPNVKIGKGAVVMAGSIVLNSIPPMTVVQGNPAKPIAKCGTPLTMKTTLKQFSRNLKKL